MKHLCQLAPLLQQGFGFRGLVQVPQTSKSKENCRCPALQEKLWLVDMFHPVPMWDNVGRTLGRISTCRNYM